MNCLEIKPNKLSDALEIIESWIDCLEEKLRYKVMLICEEAITNQIRHATFEDKERYIEFCFDKRDDINLVFKDNAKKFDPLKSKDPDITKDLDDRELGGLGIYMIKKYSKNITYQYSNGYNILKVTV